VVLSTLPLYFLSFYELPIVVEKCINKTQLNFIWGWGSETRKISWVKVKHICRKKEMGGLGVKNHRAFSSSLLGKWLWRLGSNSKWLWKEIKESKYGLCRSNMDNNSGKQSRWWKDIMTIGKNESGN